MRLLSLALLALLCCATAPVHAADTAGKPDLLSFGMGWMNFDKSEPHRRAVDYRLEYRFGTAWQVSDSVGFHPFLGFEGTSHALLYPLGGFAMDWDFCPHGVFTWQEGVGYLDSGNMRTMGGTLQFRSQAELGYRFDSNLRISAEFSHISNAKMTRINPGSEILGLYVHVPIWSLVK